MSILFLILFYGLVFSELSPSVLSDAVRSLGCVADKVVDVAPYFKLFVGSPGAKNFFQQRGRTVTLISKDENQLKQFVKQKVVVCSKPERASAQEVENVLSRMRCEHVGVFSTNDGRFLPKENLRPAEVYFVQVDESQNLVFYKCGTERNIECTKDFLEKMGQLNVWIWGGCFNGLHKGHRSVPVFAESNFNRSSSESASSKLVVFVESTPAVAKKKIRQGHSVCFEEESISSEHTSFVQGQRDRVNVLRYMFSGIIICLPRGFTKYRELIYACNGSRLLYMQGEDEGLRQYLETHVIALNEGFPGMTRSTLPYPAVLKSGSNSSRGSRVSSSGYMMPRVCSYAGSSLDYEQEPSTPESNSSSSLRGRASSGSSSSSKEMPVRPPVAVG